MSERGLPDAEHGTTIAYRRHLRAGETPCQPCRDAAAAVERERRRSRGISPAPTLECGTHSGYVGHIVRDQAPCAACRDGHAEYQRGYRRRVSRAARRGKWIDVVADYIETHGPLPTRLLHEYITDRHPGLRMDTLHRTVARLLDDGRITVAYGDGVHGDPYNYKIVRQ